MAVTEPQSDQPESDVYTVLVIVATVFLAAGTIFVAYGSQLRYDTWLPF